MKIHTTIGVYSNDDYKINGVTEENLQDHIEYNKTMRWGRALFVDGKCIYKGYLDEGRCKKWEEKIAESPEKFTKNEDTQPYV